MELRGKRVLVVGLGESGLAMAKWLHRQGAVVRVADSRDNPPNVEALQAVAPAAELLAGAFSAEPFAWADLVALSPGVPKATPEIAGVAGKLVSEIELFAAGVRAARQEKGGVILCVGAAVDFLSGTLPRAPEGWQRLGLEWLHRLLSEPRRLWRRYLVDGPKVFLIYLRRRRAGDP